MALKSIFLWGGRGVMCFFREVAGPKLHLDLVLCASGILKTSDGS